MRGPKPTPVVLTDTVRAELEQVIHRHTTPQQIALRARITLAAADGLSHTDVARSLDISLDTARLWRRRWLGREAVDWSDLSLLDRLADAPRSGSPVKITAEQVCWILERACEAPERSGRPISQWGEREIADEVRARGIVETISDRHAARLLNRGRLSRTAGATG